MERLSGTLFARENAELFRVLKEIFSNAPKNGGMAADSGAGQTVPSPAVAMIETPEQMQAALRRISGGYDGKGRFFFRKGRLEAALLRGCHGVNDKILEFIAGLDPRVIDVSSTDVASLESIRNARNLRALIVADTAVRSLAPISGVRLMKLDISGTEVSDISPLKNSSLRELRMGNCPVKDYSILSECGDLRILEPEELWRKVPGHEGTRNPPPRRREPPQLDF